jgi:hypothetical protein
MKIIIMYTHSHIHAHELYIVDFIESTYVNLLNSNK